MTERPPLSIVVPTRDRPGFLAHCLEALRPEVRPDDEVIVIDSASRDGATRDVAERFGARIIRCDLPGASRARNAGWRAALHAIVAFLDDDITVYPGWADAFARCMSAFPDAAFATGKIGSPPDDPPEYPLALKLDPDPAWIEYETPAPLGHTASLVVRRDAMGSVGGFDEELGAGGQYPAAEDQDLFDRLLRHGFRGRYEPGAFAIHRPWRTRKEILALEWAYGLGSGARLSKLVREDRRRVRKFLDENVVHFARGLVNSIRIRYKFLVVVSIIRLAGTVVGFARAMTRPVRAGHLVPRRALLGARAHPRIAPPSVTDA